MNINIKITRQENADYFHTSVGSVVSVELEEYVAAVVASELASGSLEAMKAQAVAARTFACCLGALRGKAVSDSSATAQAYRAARYDAQKYPRCIEAARATAGEILTYKGKPINAVYSDSNGGRTVSASERWGSSRPYLIAKTDPWDLAATGGNRRGHGVGMSQQGAKRMAAEGIGYREILDFYYPGCETSSVSADALPPSPEGEGITKGHGLAFPFRGRCPEGADEVGPLQRALLRRPPSAACAASPPRAGAILGRESREGEPTNLPGSLGSKRQENSPVGCFQRRTGGSPGEGDRLRWRGKEAGRQPRRDVAQRQRGRPVGGRAAVKCQTAGLI